MAKSHTRKYWTDINGNEYKTRLEAEASDKAIAKTKEDEKKASIFKSIISRVWDERGGGIWRLKDETLATLADIYSNFCQNKKKQWGKNLNAVAKMDLDKMVHILFMEQCFNEVKACVYKQFYEEGTYDITVEDRNGRIYLNRLNKIGHMQGITLVEACNHVSELLVLGSENKKADRWNIAKGVKKLNDTLSWQWEDSSIESATSTWLSTLQGLDLSQYEVYKKEIMLKHK